MVSLEYVAGFFDGEGSVSLTESTRAGNQRPSFRLGISIQQNTPRTLSIIQQMFGGSICTGTTPRGNTTWKWQITCKNAKPFLVAIEPFLIEKREEVQVAIRACDTFGPTGTRVDVETLIARKELLNSFLNIRNAKREISYG